MLFLQAAVTGRQQGGRVLPTHDAGREESSLPKRGKHLPLLLLGKHYSDIIILLTLLLKLPASSSLAETECCPGLEAPGNADRHSLPGGQQQVQMSNWQQQHSSQQASSNRQHSYQQQPEQQRFLQQQQQQHSPMQSGAQRGQAFMPQRSLRQQALQQLLNDPDYLEQATERASDAKRHATNLQNEHYQSDWQSSDHQEHSNSSANPSREAWQQQAQQQQHQALPHQRLQGWVSLRESFDPASSWEPESGPARRTASNPIFEASTWHDVIDLTQQDDLSSASGDVCNCCLLPAGIFVILMSSAPTCCHALTPARLQAQHAAHACSCRLLL